MERKAVSGIMLSLLLLGMLTLTFNIELARSSSSEVLFFDDFSDELWTEQCARARALNSYIESHGIMISTLFFWMSTYENRMVKVE